MKTKLSFIFILTFGFGVAGTANTSIPAPIFYQLSKRLLIETQYFVEAGDAKTAKAKAVRVKGSSGDLKCQSKKEQGLKSFGVLGFGNSESLWKMDSDN